MSLLVKLGLDSAEMDRGLAKAETNVGKSMKSMGKTMMMAGGIMTAGLTLPIVAMGVKMVSSASNMEESLNKVNVVFGESASEIKAWASTAAKSMGMSNQQALEAAGTYGNLFQAMGLGLKPAADMSKAIVGLAADMASFNNASPEETLLALRSGLSGEMEPLKKYGVALNEAAMKSMALSMGLGDNILALTEAEKVQIRYAIIVKQTSMAQGDFARTSEGLANTTRIAKAQLADMSAILGTQLLPIGLKVVTFVSDLVGKFSALTSGQQKAIVMTLGVVAAIGPLVTIVGALTTGIGALIPLFTKLATAVHVYGMSTVATAPLVHALTVAFGAQAVAIGAVVLPILAVVAAVGLLIVASTSLESWLKKNGITISKFSTEMDKYGNHIRIVEDATIATTTAVDSATQSYTAWALAVENGTLAIKDGTIATVTLAEKLELVRVALVDRTGWEVMYTSAKDALERTDVSLDWLGRSLQELSAEGAAVWRGFLVSTGQISPAAIAQFILIQEAFERIKAYLSYGFTVPMIINVITKEFPTIFTGPTTPTGGDWVRAGPNTTPGKTGGWWKNTVTGRYEERARGGAFSGWAMVGDMFGGGITPYTEWVYAPHGAVVYNQAQMAGISAPSMAGGGNIGDVTFPSPQPALDEAKLARMIRDAVLQVLR